MEQLNKYLVGYELPDDVRWYKWRSAAMKHLVDHVIEPTIYSKKTTDELNKTVETLVTAIKTADSEDKFDEINSTIMSTLTEGSVINDITTATHPKPLDTCDGTSSLHVLVNETVNQYNQAIDKLSMHGDLPDNIDNTNVEKPRIDINEYREILEHNETVENLLNVRSALAASVVELGQIDPNLELVKSKRDIAASLLNGTVERLRIADIPVKPIAGAFDQPMSTEMGLVIIVAVIIVLILLIIRKLFVKDTNPTAYNTITYKESFEQPQSTGTDDIIENSLRV